MKTLLLIRHGHAEDSSPMGDVERELTQEGRLKMRLGARGIKRLVPDLDAVISSPLVRARQTARIVATLYSLEPRQSVTLAPGMDYARALRHAVDTGGQRVALVGHEPDLGRFACWLLGGEAGRCMPLRKGGACAIEFLRDPGAGAGRLDWLATAKLLRQLGGQPD